MNEPTSPRPTTQATRQPDSRRHPRQAALFAAFRALESHGGNAEHEWPTVTASILGLARILFVDDDGDGRGYTTRELCEITGAAPSSVCERLYHLDSALSRHAAGTGVRVTVREWLGRRHIARYGISVHHHCPACGGSGRDHSGELRNAAPLDMTTGRDDTAA